MKTGYMGNNEIHLNEATVIVAMQEYLNSIHMTGMAPRVRSVTYNAGVNSFIVKTEDKPRPSDA